MGAPEDRGSHPGYRPPDPRARIWPEDSLPALPDIPDARRGDHVWFEVSGGHATALGVLRRHLGLAGTARAAVGLAKRQLRGDPFAGQPPIADTAEWLTRRQLAPVLLLEDTLREDLELDREETLSVLSDLVAQVGARLLSRRFPSLSPAAWAAASPEARERLARRVFDRLGNITTAEIRTTDQALELDVTGCRFVQLLHALGRPHLAPLFCAADSVFFEEATAPVTLDRSSTLAGGAHACDFRFRLRTP